MQVIPAVRGLTLQATLVGMDSIHKRIKRLREDKGLSQEALGALVGVKYQSVQEWEREKGTAPSRKRMEDVAKALGVSVTKLLFGDADQVQEPAAAYEQFSSDERALIARYRAADPRWQLSLRLTRRACDRGSAGSGWRRQRHPRPGIREEAGRYKARLERARP